MAQSSFLSNWYKRVAFPEFMIKIAGALMRSEKGQQGSYPCGLGGRQSICWILSTLKFHYSIPLRTDLRQFFNGSSCNPINRVTEFIHEKVVDSFVKSRNCSWMPWMNKLMQYKIRLRGDFRRMSFAHHPRGEPSESRLAKISCEVHSTNVIGSISLKGLLTIDVGTLFGFSSLWNIFFSILHELLELMLISRTCINGKREFTLSARKFNSQSKPRSMGPGGGSVGCPVRGYLA